MSDTVFITGGASLLAVNWAIALRDRVPVTLGLHDRQVELARVGRHSGSLDTIDDVSRILDVVQPGLVVHTAGLTNIEFCEANPDLAYHVNVELAANVAAACARRGVPLAHVSTDHLFVGDQPWLDESHPVAPQNAYGRTKAEGERRVLNADAAALVVRTNFYGWGPRYRRSFSDVILDSLRKGQAITLFTDVWYTPILAEALSLAVHDLVALKASGIVHVVGDDRLSKHEFGLKLAREFQLDAGLIKPGLLGDQAALVRRPREISLSNRKVCQLLGRPLGGVDEHLRRLHQLEQLGLMQELQDL